MDNISLGTLIDIALKLGMGGILLVIWYFDRKDMSKLIEDRRAETAEILKKYEADAREAREMYRNNVKLVEGYQSIANDIHSVVVLNVQKLTEMKDSIQQNQYCPVLRVRKELIEVGKE